MKTALVSNECLDLKYKRKPLFDKDSKDSSIQECSDCRTDNWEIIRQIKNDLRDNLSFILCFVQSIERIFPFMTDRFSSDKLEHQHANSSGFLHYCLSSYFHFYHFWFIDCCWTSHRNSVSQSCHQMQMKALDIDIYSAQKAIAQRGFLFCASSFCDTRPD